jgi:hypothetical protein
MFYQSTFSILSSFLKRAKNLLYSINIDSSFGKAIPNSSSNIFYRASSGNLNSTLDKIYLNYVIDTAPL